jgi:DNA mismatch endonuclease (patch repair protein)
MLDCSSKTGRRGNLDFPFYNLCVTDTISRKRRSENMRRIKSKGMKPELTVRHLVHSLGYRYRLHSPALPGKPDLVFTVRKKIIEVRGCFWHMHGKCIDSHIPKSRKAYWSTKLLKNRLRDRKNVRELKRRGWKVLILWECQIAEKKQLAAQINRFLQ